MVWSESNWNFVEMFFFPPRKFLNKFFLGPSKNLHSKLPPLSNQAQYRKRNKTDPHGCNYYWNSTVKHQSIHTALNSTILQVRVNAATNLTTTWYVSLFALLLLSIEMLHCKLFSIVSHLCYFTLRVGFIFCCCCCINLTTVGHSKNAVCRSQKLHHAIDRIFLRFLFSFLFLHSRSIWITFRFSVNCCVNVMFVSQLCYFLCWKVMDVEVFMSLVFNGKQAWKQWNILRKYWSHQHRIVNRNVKLQTLKWHWFIYTYSFPILTLRIIKFKGRICLIFIYY